MMDGRDFSIHDRAPTPVIRPSAMGRGTALLVLAVVVALLLLPPPRGDRALGALAGLGHVLLGYFLVAALRALFVGGGGLAPGSAGLLALLTGAVVLIAAESAHPFVGGTFSVEDLLGAAAGGAAAAAFGWARRPQAAGTWLLVLLGLALLGFGARPWVADLLDASGQEAELPLLSGFESPLELRRWHVERADAQRVRAHATEGEWSLEVAMEAGTYPRVELHWPVPDWRGWDGFAFDVQADGAGMLPVVLEVRDREALDGPAPYERRFLLDPSGATVEVPTAEIEAGTRGRELDLADIARVVLVLDASAAERKDHLDHVRLVRSPR